MATRPGGPLQQREPVQEIRIIAIGDKFQVWTPEKAYSCGLYSKALDEALDEKSRTGLRIVSDVR